MVRRGIFDRRHCHVVLVSCGPQPEINAPVPLKHVRITRDGDRGGSNGSEGCGILALFERLVHSGREAYGGGVLGPIIRARTLAPGKRQVVLPSNND